MRVFTARYAPSTYIKQTNSVSKGLKCLNDEINQVKGKGKVIPLQARCGPEGG